MVVGWVERVATVGPAEDLKLVSVFLAKALASLGLLFHWLVCGAPHRELMEGFLEAP